MIWEKFKKHVFADKLVVSGDKVLLAVSGGADSMAMACLFSRLKKILDIELLIVNFNHNLRKESLKEAETVSAFAKKIGAECILQDIPTKRYARENDVSLETAGRHLRYENLEKLAKKNKCGKIATAHNMNDNAETVLMWLVRGTGSEGLSGIPVVRKINAKVSVVRPMLSISRDLIERYVKDQKIKFCTDKTNFKCDFTRNKIRMQIIPKLKKLNPSVIEHIFNLSNIISGENKYFQKKAEAFISKHVRAGAEKIVVDLKAFCRCEHIIKLKILKEILPDKKRAVHVNGIIGWLKNKKSKKYVLSKFWIVSKSKNNITFRSVTGV